jgi:hypothetical protein
MVVRVGILLAGLAIGGFGVWSLLRLGISNLLWTLLWLTGGIVGHDGLLAAVTLALVAVGRPLLPVWARGPVAAGLVVLGTVTVMAIPVLGRFGARPDVPSLLDRSYGVGWLAFAGIVAAGVVVASGVQRYRHVARAARRGAPLEDRHG